MTTDDALLLRVANGDGDALVELNERWRRWVASLILARFAWLAGEIDDIRQDLALRVWAGANRFQAGGNGAGWIKTIAWNICLDRARQTNYRAERTPLIPAPYPPPSVLDALVSAEIAGQLEKVALEASDRPAWRARIADPEARGVELAAAMGIPVGTFKTHLRRARLQVCGQAYDARGAVIDLAGRAGGDARATT